MHIDHIAVYTEKLEELKDFYTLFFNGVAGPKYTNPRKQFQSYFIRFQEGADLEIMAKTGIPSTEYPVGHEHLGITHFAFSIGTKTGVDALTDKLRKAGFVIVGEPRTTGDGMYESVILDPDGNRIEIME